MRPYQNIIRSILKNGTYKENRTDVDTISDFSYQYKVDVDPDEYPLLTTKKMDTYRWDSLRHELEWYLSGQEHIRELREETKIWDAWADENGHLDTAYGRFWRRYPIPQPGPDRLSGETWAGMAGNHRWSDNDDVDASRWINHEWSGDEPRYTFDQLQYVADMLRENPKSRRLVVNAWHPANATISTLPPCHYSFVFNVQGDDTLNLHLTQRSADVALGVPFNIACYSAILIYMAQRTGFKVGEFGHTLVDAHLYCGSGERGRWYADNLSELQDRMQHVETDDEYRYLREWILDTAPDDESATDPSEHKYGDDHIPGLLEQLAREPYDRPSLEISDKPLDDLRAEDIELTDYESHGGLTFGVAE